MKNLVSKTLMCCNHADRSIKAGMIKYTTAFLKSEGANNLNGKLAIMGIKEVRIRLVL